VPATTASRMKQIQRLQRAFRSTPTCSSLLACCSVPTFPSMSSCAGPRCWAYICFGFKTHRSVDGNRDTDDAMLTNWMHLRIRDSPVVPVINVERFWVHNLALNPTKSFHILPQQHSAVHCPLSTVHCPLSALYQAFCNNASGPHTRQWQEEESIL
jgi:hypothetical protein